MARLLPPIINVMLAAMAPPPPSIDETVRMLIRVASTASPGAARMLISSTGGVAALNLATAYRPEVP